MDDDHPIAVKFVLHTDPRTLEVVFDNGDKFMLSWEYLRVYSPSAEVRSRVRQQQKLVANKQSVAVTDIKPVGNYAIKLLFDDGHNTGIYDWAYLYELGSNYETYWQEYLGRLRTSNQTSDETT
jgi:DUF971 family protein